MLPDHGVLLFTPRTGSRALAKMMLAYPSARETKDVHHVHPDAVDSYAISNGASGWEPRLAVIRNPYKQTASWFSHIVLRHDSSKNTLTDYKNFLRTTEVPWYFVDRLNVYATVPDVTLIPYSRNSLTTVEQIRTCFSLPKIEGIKSEQVGESRPVEFAEHPEAKELVAQRFKHDIELWNKYGHSDTD